MVTQVSDEAHESLVFVKNDFLIAMTNSFGIITVGKNIIKSRATLVICPASLIHHWYKEIERRVKGNRLQVLMYHGQNREKNVHR